MKIKHKPKPRYFQSEANEIREDQGQFVTSDLPLASVLLMNEYEVIEVRPSTNPRIYMFVFSVPTDTMMREIEEITQAFSRQEIEVEPLEYYQAIRKAKGLIYESQTGNHPTLFSRNRNNN